MVTVFFLNNSESGLGLDVLRVSKKFTLKFVVSNILSTCRIIRRNEEILIHVIAKKLHIFDASIRFTYFSSNFENRPLTEYIYSAF